MTAQRPTRTRRDRVLTVGRGRKRVVAAVAFDVGDGVVEGEGMWRWLIAGWGAGRGGWHRGKT
jgi:hypothetical protein